MMMQQAQPMGAGAYYEPAFDDNDAAIVQEAAQAQLALDDKKEVALQQQESNSMWTVLSNTYRAGKLRTYRVRTVDGLAWTYTQPYSTTMSAQLPGEHSFILRGTPQHPITVVPPDSSWRRPKFIIGVATLCTVLLFAYGIGILAFILIALAFPMRSRFKSNDPAFAKFVKSQIAITTAVRATKWGWLGLLGSGGWKLPWVVQLYSLGDGSSRLVIKAPDIGRHNLTRWRVGFAQAANLARAFQTILPPDSSFPKQEPFRVS
ncbi:MAG: hypothetical protein ABI183_08250 [Polyangiaceae bacterium]